METANYTVGVYPPCRRNPYYYTVEFVEFMKKGKNIYYLDWINPEKSQDIIISSTNELQQLVNNYISLGKELPEPSTQTEGDYYLDEVEYFIAKVDVPKTINKRAKPLRDKVITKRAKIEQKMKREEVYKIINGERNYQDNMAKQNTYQLGNPTVEAELSLIEHYILEARKKLVTIGGDDVCLDMLRKVAGIAVRCFENHGCPHRK